MAHEVREDANASLGGCAQVLQVGLVDHSAEGEDERPPRLADVHLLVVRQLEVGDIAIKLLRPGFIGAGLLPVEPAQGVRLSQEQAIARAAASVRIG